jgi:fructosamine-3-kinase
MALPEALTAAMTDLAGAPLEAVRLLGGRDISTAARVEAGGRSILVKWQGRPQAVQPGWLDVFAAEAAGLRLLARAGALRVPEVLRTGAGGDGPAYILMEWIEWGNAGHQQVGVALGEGLAALHRSLGPQYGLDHGNYCGATPQDNRWCASWVEFYGTRRLGWQMALARRRGLLPAARRRGLERLIDRLDEWIGDEACQPSLLHGDLWGGNWLVAQGGEPVLIDPAAYYGDREAELAMCRLFGGFPGAFYAAYDAAWPPAAGRADRIPLYQLYHLLNHLNLFGESYGSSVDAIWRRYVGQ